MDTTHTQVHPVPPHGNTSEQDTHGVGLRTGEEEPQHEKQSVMKKVKARAKKIRETITGHGQHHHDDHNHSSNEEEEEDGVDDGDVEMVHDPDLHRSSEDVNTAKPKAFGKSEDVNIQRPKDFATGEDVNNGKPKVSLGDRLHLEENPQAPPKHPNQTLSPRNHQTKVTDPTGAGHEEAGIGPMVHSFGKMDVRDEPTRGSRDQFTSTKTQTDPPRVPESFNPTDHPQGMDVDDPTHPTTHTGKIASPTSAKNGVAGGNEGTVGAETNREGVQGQQPGKGYTAAIADKAILAKNAVASKLGYGGTTGAETNREGVESQQSGKGYTAAIADKAISAKNVVASKLGYGANQGTTGTETNKGGVQHPGHGYNEGTTGTEADREGVQQPGKGYTAAITDKAISAKNAVATKFGYGGNESAPAPGTEANKAVHGEHGSGAGTGGGVMGYGRQVSGTVKEKLAPVYGTVAGAGSAVLSKVTGSGTGTHTGTDKEGASEGNVRDTRTGTHTGGDGVGVADKGVGMKGYLAEKLKPSEEDKALSEVISDALHKRKAEEGVKEDKPMGKVTESPEVARQLGTESYSPRSKDSTGNSVVDWVKGSVTSWFGKDGETNPSQASHAAPLGSGEEEGLNKREDVHIDRENEGDRNVSK